MTTTADAVGKYGVQIDLMPAWLDLQFQPSHDEIWLMVVLFKQEGSHKQHCIQVTVQVT